jgi:hypothetical protein
MTPWNYREEVEQAPECMGENEKHEAHRSILTEMQYTVRSIPRVHMVRRAKRKRRTVRTISEAGPEVVRDGMVELCVDGVEEELLFSVGHETMKGERRGMEGGDIKGRRRVGRTGT